MHKAIVCNKATEWFNETFDSEIQKPSLSPISAVFLREWRNKMRHAIISCICICHVHQKQLHGPHCPHPTKAL